jgi:hypothetical protein
VFKALYAVQERGGIGKLGCYELVFPVSIQLPDSTTATVADYDAMKAAIRAYFQANGTGAGTGIHQHGGNRFHFVYPVDVLNQDGVILTVNNETELRALRADCPGFTGGPGGNHNGHSNHLRCFDFVYPITIAFPDGTTATATSGANMRTIIKDWKQANPTVSGRPEIAFPITVKLTVDSSLVVVNSKQELHDLRKDCK